MARRLVAHRLDIARCVHGGHAKRIDLAQRTRAGLRKRWRGNRMPPRSSGSAARPHARCAVRRSDRSDSSRLSRSATVRPAHSPAATRCARHIEAARAEHAGRAQEGLPRAISAGGVAERAPRPAAARRARSRDWPAQQPHRYLPTATNRSSSSPSCAIGQIDLDMPAPRTAAPSLRTCSDDADRSASSFFKAGLASRSVCALIASVPSDRSSAWMRSRIGASRARWRLRRRDRCRANRDSSVRKRLPSRIGRRSSSFQSAP